MIEEQLTMKCIRCNKEMPLDNNCPHNPMSGLSLEATGNWPSSVWDNERRVWFVLCDKCAEPLIYNAEYCLEEIRPPRPHSVFRAVKETDND